MCSLKWSFSSYRYLFQIPALHAMFTVHPKVSSGLAHFLLECFSVVFSVSSTKCLPRWICVNSLNHPLQKKKCLFKTNILYSIGLKIILILIFVLNQLDSQRFYNSLNVTVL